jgi:hypothetical protein
MLISVTVMGVTPLILDAFSNDALMPGPKTTNTPEADTPLEQTKKKLYTDRHGMPVIPGDNMLSCLIAAGKYLKLGKKQLTTRDSTIITSFLSIPEILIPIRSKEGWRVFSRSIVNQKTKGRVMCHRPLFDDWELDFTIDLNTQEATEKLARDLVDRAGTWIGLAVMRPERKGRYGQFKVRCWDCKTATESFEEVVELRKKVG